MPNLVSRSGREPLSVKDRIDLMRADLMTPPFSGVSDQTRAVTQSIHDLKMTIGRIRNTIALYECARARGTTDEQLQNGADRMLSDTECLVLAWRRGGHREYDRVHRAQRASEAAT